MTTIEPISFIPVLFEKKTISKRGDSWAVYVPTDFHKPLLETLRDKELIAVTLGGRVLVYVPKKLTGIEGDVLTVDDKEQILFDIVFTALEGLFSITDKKHIKDAVHKAYAALVEVEDKSGFVSFDEIEEVFEKLSKKK